MIYIRATMLALVLVSVYGKTTFQDSYGKGIIMILEGQQSFSSAQ